MDEESAVTEDGHALFRQTVPVSVAGEQVGQEFLRSLVAFLSVSNGIPAAPVQVFGQAEFGTQVSALFAG
jgi:hypothetical protein